MILKVSAQATGTSVHPAEQRNSASRSQARDVARKIMTILNVRHTTSYRYRRSVRFGDHRLMLRPRDTHDLRLIRTGLTCSPKAEVKWRYDVFGNSIAVASFAEPAAELRIESSLEL